MTAVIPVMILLPFLALMVACAGSALLAVRLPPVGQVSLAMAWGLIYGFLMWGVGRLERRHATVSSP